MPLRLAIDVDDCTADLVTLWLKAYNIAYEDNLSPTDILSWDICSYAKKCQPEQLFSIIPNLNPRLINPIEGSIEAIKKLQSWGVETIFVTASSNWDKGTWLLEHELIENERDLIIAFNKQYIDSDVLVDDSPDNILRFKKSGKLGILFGAPWNGSSTTWKDILDVISFCGDLG